MNTATAIASTILAKVKELPSSLLNWDGSASQDDVLFNLKHYVHRITGWELLSVKLEGSVLSVCEPNQLLLSYDVESGREIYGRVRHLGLTQAMLGELHAHLP